MSDPRQALTGVVDHRYVIERELGRGGMATVYLAEDKRHGNKVALKVLSADLASVLSGDRFTREIRITAALQHPLILPVFDSGVINGLPYYVMPFVDGPTLEQKLIREGQLPIHDALEIACDVADALHHAHVEGFVHRDIKPSNVLLAHGHAMVADFGIARTVEALADDKITQVGMALGTASYMSPEQAAGDKVDGRSDIYSLGCVLYEMIAGHPPFSAPSPRALMARHWTDSAPSIRTVRPTVSAAVEAIISKAMAKAPADRFQTGREVMDAIRRAGTEESIAAAVEARGESGLVASADESSPSRRPRPSAARVGLTVAVAAVLLAVAVWQFSTPEEAALDRNRVMVYPLVVPADFGGSSSTGEDLATLIGSALDGAGPLRWIDGWPLLDPGRRQNIRALTTDDARSLARSRRCAYYLIGRLVALGDSAEIILDLKSVEGDSTVALGVASGAVGDAWRIALRAVNSVLPALIPAGTHDIAAAWNDRKPAAIASYLLGESAFRRVHLPEALVHYRDAVKADSTFALAAIRGAQAATWNHRAVEAESFIQTALQQPMPPRYSSFARGYQAYLDGRADSAAAEFRRAIRIDREMTVAWMQLGEVYVHLLPRGGNPDSLALDALDEAHRLDSGARNLLLHSIEIRLRRGEAAATEPMLKDFLAADPDTLLAGKVQIMYDCVTKGPAAVDWTRIATEKPLALLVAANSLKGAGAQLPCALRAYEAVIANDTTAATPGSGRRWAAIVGTANVLLAQGRFAEARSRLDDAIARGWGGAAHYLTAGVFVPELRQFARIVADQDAVIWGPAYARCPFNPRLWQLGMFEAYAGRPAVAQAVARELDSRARKSGSSSDGRLARSMEAHSALAQADTARALELLAALLAWPAPTPDVAWDVAAPLGAERLVLARLLNARKDYRGAIDVANVLDASWPSTYLLYLPASLSLRAEAAGHLSDRELASRFQNRLAALRGGRVIAGQ